MGGRAKPKQKMTKDEAEIEREKRRLTFYLLLNHKVIVFLFCFFYISFPGGF